MKTNKIENYQLHTVKVLPDKNIDYNSNIQSIRCFKNYNTGKFKLVQIRRIGDYDITFVRNKA